MSDVQDEQVDPSVYDLTLDEYCLRKSNDPTTGVEMLHGFRAYEISIGTVKASQRDFDSRLADFATRPVA